MATTVYAFRGRNDDGNETTATWKANQNTTWVQARDANFRIRFGVQNDTSNINNLDVQLQYSLNGTDWVAVNATSSYVRSSASPNVADGANLTEQLTGGTGTFEGATAFDEVNGICGGTSYDIASTEYFEHEFCCQVRSAEAANGIQIWLRTINSDSGAPWTTYNVTATLWVGWMPLSAAPSADNWGNLDDSLVFDLTAGPTPLTATPDADAWQNLADGVSIYRTEARAGWEDALAFIKTTGLFADLPADSAANLADAIETLRQGFLTADIPADSAANLADSLDILLMAFLTADLPADDAANLADALEVLRMGALSADLPADDAANLADILEVYAAYFATLSDDALFADDSVVFELGTVLLPLTIELSDALETLADALDVLLSGLLVADLPADDAANLDDALAVLYMALLTADLPSDSAANFADILEAIEDYFADLSDDALTVNDSLAVELTGEATPLTVELSDAMENFADSAELTLVIWTLLVDLADDATNLSDSLSILFRLGPGWADILTLFETLNVAQTDSAANLDDGQLQLSADHELTFDEDDLNQWADSSTFILADIVNLTVNLADDATNLDDSLDVLVQTRAGWEDGLGAIEGLNASEADDAANLADAYETIHSLFVSSIDSAANLADVLEALEAYFAALSDDAVTVDDALDAEVVIGFLALTVELSDEMGTCADAVSATAASFGELLISLPFDSMQNAADLLGGFMTLDTTTTDAAAYLDDPLVDLVEEYYAAFADELDQWGDSSIVSVSSFLALLADLPADSMTIADILSGLRELRADVSDDGANFSDSLALFAALLADMPDDAAHLNDLLAAFVSQFGQLLIVLPPDQLNNFADYFEAARQLFAELPPDAMANLGDILAVVSATFVELLVSFPADEMATLTDAVTRIEGLLAALDSDDAAELADNLEALLTLTPGEANLFARQYLHHNVHVRPHLYDRVTVKL